MTTQTKTQLYFEDVNVGDAVTDLVKGPMSPVHLFRWSAAVENMHRIHYDESFSKEHDKLPERLVNGSWKQHIMTQMMKDWAGMDGWLWKIGFAFRGMDPVWSTMTAHGTVVDKRDLGQWGVVECEIGMRNEAGAENTPGTATVVLPKRGGPAVPYPFVPPKE